MKEIRKSTTVQYDAIVISEATSVKFRKEVNSDKVSVFGTIVKNEAEVGLITYSRPNDTLTTHISKHSQLTAEELTAIYAAVPAAVAEIIAPAPANA